MGASVRHVAATLPTDEQLARQFVAQRLRQPAVEGAVLFGSRAKGHPRDDSDYDLLVVAEGSPGQEMVSFGGRDFDLIFESFGDLSRGLQRPRSGNNNIQLEVLATGLLLEDRAGRLAALAAMARRRFAEPAPPPPPGWAGEELRHLDAMRRSCERLLASRQAAADPPAWQAVTAMRQDDVFRRCVQALCRAQRRWSTAFPVLVLRGGLSTWPPVAAAWERWMAAGQALALRQAALNDLVAWTAGQLHDHGQR